MAELNTSVLQRIESAHPNVWIAGEISNLSRYASGHYYFTLKDGGSEISAVMFASANRWLKFAPADGYAVLARGRPTLWVPRGRYQFIVEEMEPRGRGSLLEAFEALKQRLLGEGLFDAARKRPIPVLPSRIGIVTSPDGAAFHDLLKVLRRRHAGVDILLAPVRVQGEGAALEIAFAIEALGRVANLDVLIVGRGGGSIEDLWAFNEERVARAICACPIPVISAVGHETDVTIADFAADVRAATPSHAAELVVASRDELAGRLASHRARLSGAARWRIGEAAARLGRIERTSALARFPMRVSSHGQDLDDLAARLVRSEDRRLEAYRRKGRELALRLAPRHLLEVVRRREDVARSGARRLAGAMMGSLLAHRGRAEAAAGLLRSLSPLNVLERGYAICTDSSGRIVLKSSQDAVPGEDVLVRLSRGALDCRVLARRPPQEEPS